MADLRTDAATGATTSVRQRVLVLVVLALVQFTSIVDFMVVMPLGPQIIAKLGLRSADQFSLIVASYSISAGLAGLLASSIMDRFGRKKAYLSLFAGFLLGTLACGLAREYFTLVAARALAGAFGGILGGLGLTIIADVFPEEQRGRATGVLMSAFALAPAFGVPIGLHLGELYGWYMPFLILAALGSVVFIVGVLVMPPLRGHLHQSAYVRPLAQIVETFRQPGNLISFAFTAAVMFGAFSVIPFISLSLVANVGVPREKLWQVFATAGIMTLFGAPLIGGLADRFGKLLVFRIVALFSACVILVVTNLPVVPLAAAALVVGLLMVSNAGRMAASMSMITASVASRSRGGLMSANSAVQHISAGLAASTGGWILGPLRDGHMRNFDVVGLVSLGSALLSVWIAGWVRRAGGTDSGLLEKETTRAAADVQA
jgi:MFS transporter, DHA1 family, inner membrane transport protein